MMSSVGGLLILGVAALALAVAGLRDPQLAVLYLLVTMYFRSAVPKGLLPADPFLFAFAGVLAAMFLFLTARPDLVPRVGVLEALMTSYVLWNVYSWAAPHALPAVSHLLEQKLTVYRFILTGTVIPFTMYLVGRTLFRGSGESDPSRDRSRVRQLLWAVLGFGMYSAWVSILQFHGPKALVWPKYIISAPNWEGRANGVFNQPVVNGFSLIGGFLAAVAISAQQDEPRWRRLVAVGVGAACAFGVYLTHTRAVWLSFFVVLLVGAALMRGVRAAFAGMIGLVLVVVAVNWSTFTSSDRASGGVASANEAHDRLNAAATSFWAIAEHPLAGWGIGRFTAVNTLYHRQWSQDIPWERGYGISSHLNELGIFVELGVIGLLLWLGVLVFVVWRLVTAFRLLPDQGWCGRNFAVTALLLLGTLVVGGLTVDLRYFDYPNALAFLLAGIAVGWAERVTSIEVAEQEALT